MGLSLAFPEQGIQAAALIKHTHSTYVMGFMHAYVQHDYGEFGNLKGACLATEFTLCPEHCCFSASWQDSLTIPSITGRESVAASDARWNLKQVSLYLLHELLDWSLLALCLIGI